MKPGLYLRDITCLDDAEEQMLDIGVCREGVDIMLPKMKHFTFMVRAMDPRGANILKQEMLAAGGEAAISYSAISDLSRPTDCLLSGTDRQFSIAAAKLERQPFGLKALSEGLKAALLFTELRGTRKMGPLRIGERTLVMGILNVTLDSFSGDGITEPGEAVARAIRMEGEGADIIDVGGESTRPGAPRVTAKKETARVIPVIRALRKELNIPISIDSRNPAVVGAALDAGAGLANLVGGLRSVAMAKVLARNEVPAILMHMQGDPATMQLNPEYADVMDDIVSDLRCQMDFAVRSGMHLYNFIVDPGIGFGKTVEHNLDILRRLGELRILGMPVLVGASRKSFIGKVLDAEVGDRLEGSVAAAVAAAMNGACIVRVHDVRETVRALAVADAISRPRRP